MSVTEQGVVFSLLEIMDRTTTRAVDEWKSMGLDRDAEALLIAQSDAGLAAARELNILATACEAWGATFVAESTTALEAEQLLAARRLTCPALEQLGTTLLDDVAVPRSRIPAFIRGVEQIAQDHQLLIETFGHIGDGNLHPTIVYDREDDHAGKAALAAFTDVVRAALELGGTVAGEHGIGTLKRALFRSEAGDVALRTHQTLKSALDPQGILNPGKGF